jgi:excisionase family DNA binding protein
MQNGADDRAPGGIPTLVAELLDHPDHVAALSPARARAALVEVAGAQQRLATVSMLLAVRGGDVGADGEVGAPPRAAPSEQGAFTQEEAARAYHMPLRTVRRLTRTGRIPSYRLGRNRMLRAADLDRYLARCRAQAVKVGTIRDV